MTKQMTSAQSSSSSNSKGYVRKDINIGIEDIQKGVRDRVKDIQKGVRNILNVVDKEMKNVPGAKVPYGQGLT
ncbi:MAG: hypothetical protein ABR986_11930 [Methanomassiliicoccales archaeon]|jgi:hypothetical protein